MQAYLLKNIAAFPMISLCIVASFEFWSNISNCAPSIFVSGKVVTLMVFSDLVFCKSQLGCLQANENRLHCSDADPNLRSLPYILFVNTGVLMQHAT